MKVPWMVMPSSWQSLVKRLGHLDAHALLDVVQDLLVAALVADQQQPQAVVAHNFKRFARHVGLGVARPGHAHLAELARDRLGARQVVGEGVVVEEEFLHLRHRLFRPGDLLRDVFHAARAVFVAADGLRPQAEGAARFAAAPGIEGDVRVLEIADEIILDLQVALVDRRDEGQPVHVFQHGPLFVHLDRAVFVAIDQAGDGFPVAAFRDVADGEVVVLAGDEIDGFRFFQRGARIDRDIGADQADLDAGLGRLQPGRGLRVGGEGRRRGMQHREIVMRGLGDRLVGADAVRGGVDQLGIRHHGGELGEPGRIPVGLDLAPRLVARAGAAIESVIGRRLHEQSAHSRISLSVRLAAACRRIARGSVGRAT